MLLVDIMVMAVAPKVGPMFMPILNLSWYLWPYVVISMMPPPPLFTFCGIKAKLPDTLGEPPTWVPNLSDTVEIGGRG